MSFIELSKYFAQLGSEWVLWLLVILSIISVAVVIERIITLIRYRVNVDDLISVVAQDLGKGNWQAAREHIESRKGVAPSILREGLANAESGTKVVKEVMNAQAGVQRKILFRYLNFLGTVGSNAPFIGLLGTVLGIMRAFQDLAQTTQQGPSVVMEGISEALIATAIGLLVAIPAVVAFNYFRTWANTIMADADRVSRLLLAYVEGDRTRNGHGNGNGNGNGILEEED